MTQEEIIKLANTAGFNWPDIQTTTIEQRLERFASLVAAAEREKFTNTQEFVTLPREAVERALSAIEKAVLWDKARGFVAPYVVRDPLHAGINTLRAALEQPQRKLTPQDIADSALLGNIESPFNACMHQERCKRWKAQAEQHAVDHQFESSSDNDLQSENGQLITSCSTVPAGWKLVPVVLTTDMLAAVMLCQLEANEYLEKLSIGDIWSDMLNAAPQPPVVEQPPTADDSSEVEQPQVEQERCHLCDCTGDINSLDGEWRGECPYCRPQPPRQPLTRERIRAIQHELSDTVGCSYETFARAIEAAHNIK